MEESEKQVSEAIEELRRLWDAGIASGPSIDGEEAFARIKAHLAAELESTPKTGG